jgi:hypothetical protein
MQLPGAAVDMMSDAQDVLSKETHGATRQIGQQQRACCVTGSKVFDRGSPFEQFDNPPSLPARRTIRLMIRMSDGVVLNAIVQNSFFGCNGPIDTAGRLSKYGGIKL